MLKPHQHSGRVLPHEFSIHTPLSDGPKLHLIATGVALLAVVAALTVGLWMSESTALSAVLLAAVILALATIAVFVLRPVQTYVAALDSRLQQIGAQAAGGALVNRGAFTLLAEQLLRVEKRYEQPASLVLIDIDQFKRINDTHGYAIGDAVLDRVAALLQEHTRGADVVGRIGGEEFAVFAPNTSASDALPLAEKLRQVVASTPVITENHRVDVTVSLGIAELSDQDADLESIATRADEALYEAKRLGRNRCVCSQSAAITAQAA